jgi:hypothetical protein
LAQRPGSYEILKYVRPVVKRKDSQQIGRALAPVGVIDGSRADVSFVAGLLVDKFATTFRCIEYGFEPIWAIMDSQKI